jgi:hypothetical protein
MSDAKTELEARRREKEEWARKHRFVRQGFFAYDMITTRKPNAAGFYACHPWHGGPYDEACFRLVKGGWDHEHCWVCSAKILPGGEWFAAEPPDEAGLCLECHARLFPEGGA